MFTDEVSRNHTSISQSTLRQRTERVSMLSATVGADEGTVEVEEHIWERVLWKDQPFPDNYIPPRSFLSALRRNR